MDRQLLWLNVGLVAYILPFLSCLFHSVVVTYLLYHNKGRIPFNLKKERSNFLFLRLRAYSKKLHVFRKDVGRKD